MSTDGSKKKVSRETCEHNFVISAWEFNSKTQWATHTMCQKCCEVRVLGHDPRDKKCQTTSS